MPDTPAPMPTSPEIEAARKKLRDEFIRNAEAGLTDSMESDVALAELERAVHMTTLAALAAQAPDGVREMVEQLPHAPSCRRNDPQWDDAAQALADCPEDEDGGKARAQEELTQKRQVCTCGHAALLAAFTALRGEVDHWKAEATVREERSEMWRTQYNNLRAATAANADAWGAESAALVQRAELAEEASRQDRGALQSARSEAMGWQQRAEAAEGLLGDVLLSNDIGKSHLDSEIPDWAVRVRRFLAPRGASDGSGPADREGR